MEALTQSSANYRFPDHTASQRKKEKTCKLYRHPHRHTTIFGSHNKPAEIFFIWGKRAEKLEGVKGKFAKYSLYCIYLVSNAFQRCFP